jgi:Domain of unknown function (DUF4160)
MFGSGGRKLLKMGREYLELLQVTSSGQPARLNPSRTVSAILPSIRTLGAFGAATTMFYNDHAPPHFHARYGEFEATIEIGTLSVIEGQLPRRALSLAQEWAMIHKRGIV